MQKETFSENMRMALAMKAKTQHSLAAASGLHPSRISAIATGKADPASLKHGRLRRRCRYLSRGFLKTIPQAWAPLSNFFIHYS